MMVIVTWLVLLAVILCFNHGAHRHHCPELPKKYLEDRK